MKHYKLAAVFILAFFSCSFTTFKNTSSSYIVMEKTTNTVLKGKNEHDKSLVASTAKILTALVVIENYDLDEYVSITTENQNAIGSKIYLDALDKIKRIDLLYGLLLQSGNDCASALSNNDSEIFIFQMNELCKRIGMHDSTFVNSSGLDETSYNLSTAYDMALLMCYASKNSKFIEINSSIRYSFKSAKNKNYSFANKHKLILRKNGFVGGKTGYTVKAKRILVSYYKKENTELVIVTINDSNDWNTHTNYAKLCSEYDFVTILKKGEYEWMVGKTMYHYLINENVTLPLITKDDLLVIYCFYPTYVEITISNRREVYRKIRIPLFLY